MTRPGALLFVALLAITTAIALAGFRSGLAQNPQIERVSVTSAGAEVLGPSTQAVVSANGRYVVFASDAPGLVINNFNTRDIFMHDRETGVTELVSVPLDGLEADGPSLFPDVSADGRYVVFESQANNLVDDDANNFADIFVRDMQTHTTRRVNLGPGGVEADDDSLTPSISADGRYVTFTSHARNLLSTPDGNPDRDVYLTDLVTGENELIDVSTTGTQGNFDNGGFGAGAARVSADGRYVVFGSFANNLVPNDGNDKDDIFLRDRVNHTTERLSLSTAGVEGNDHSTYPAISDDGRYVVYYSLANDLVPDDLNGEADIFVRDRQTSTTTRISGGAGVDEAGSSSRLPVISNDGKFVAYESNAENLVPNDSNVSTDIFRYDMQAGVTERVSAIAGSSDAHGNSTAPSIDGDGSVVAFQSLANGLVSNDGNQASDVFVWGKSIAQTPTPTHTAAPTNTPTPTPHAGCVPPPATPSARTGDANNDGSVNSLDALVILQFTAGLLASLPNESQADANQDGRITSIDAVLTLQFQAGLINCLPP